MTRWNSNLIFDIGMHNGSDTEYYLSQNFRVIAIDADPIACEANRAKFQREIDSGVLQILNLAIGDVEKPVTFYRCDSHTAHSTIAPEWKDPNKSYEEISVPCVTLKSIISKYGIPYYLKLDIEGLDERALRTLSCHEAPPYLSSEITVSNETVQILADLGYDRFKLINQYFHTSSSEIAMDDYGWRLLRKLGRMFPPIHRVVQSLPSDIRPKTEWDKRYEGKNPGRVKPGGSGPFAEDTHGRWLTKDETIAAIHWAKSRFDYLWMDIHARHASCLVEGMPG